MKNRKVRVVFQPERKEILTSIKTPIREAIEKAGVKVNFPCGGKGICGKCRIKVKGKLSPLTSVEKKHLQSVENDVRLACQVAVEGDVEVEIHPLSLISFPKILTDRINRKIKIKPVIKKIYLSLSPPSLKDQIADLSRLERHLGEREAIEKVRLEEGKIEVEVIGGGRARGICGSGLIDASSQLLKEKIIDSSGRLKPSSKAKEWSSRIITKNDHIGFLLVEKEKAQDGIPIILTQKDIRELQLAKGAICSGIKILLTSLGVERDEVDEVLLAGAFGSYINPESAHLIGLIPTFPKAKVRSVGNAASLGAIMALVSEKDRKQTEKISEGVDYVELASYPDFSDILTQAMEFGKQE